MSSEARSIIRSVVGVGIGMTTVLLMLAGILVQQIAGINARIDDLSASTDTRIDDLSASVDARFDDVDTRFDDLSASVNARFNDLRTEVAAQIARLNARIDDLQRIVRELYALLIDTIQRIDADG